MMSYGNDPFKSTPGLAFISTKNYKGNWTNRSTDTMQTVPLRKLTKMLNKTNKQKTAKYQINASGIKKTWLTILSF